MLEIFIMYEYLLDNNLKNIITSNKFPDNYIIDEKDKIKFCIKLTKSV